MGMRATYRYLSDKNLKELKSYYGIEDKIPEEIKEEIMDCFQGMKEFYHHILEANGNILITIC